MRDLLSKDQDVVLRLDVQGAATVRSILPDAVSIFITAESDEALIQVRYHSVVVKVAKIGNRHITIANVCIRRAACIYAVN